MTHLLRLLVLREPLSGLPWWVLAATWVLAFAWAARN